MTPHIIAAEALKRIQARPCECRECVIKHNLAAVQRITKLFEELASAIESKAMANMSAQYEQKGIIQPRGEALCA